MGSSSAGFDAFASDVVRFDLAPLLGNPQFLKLLAAAHAEGGGAFSTRDAIFEDAMKFLAHEANDQVFQRNAPTRTQRIEWADEVFAKLLLSGSEGVAVYASLDERYPALGDLGIRGEGHASILDTRLFKPAVSAHLHAVLPPGARHRLQGHAPGPARRGPAAARSR